MALSDVVEIFESLSVCRVGSSGNVGSDGRVLNNKENNTTASLSPTSVKRKKEEKNRKKKKKRIGKYSSEESEHRVMEAL